MALRAAVAGAVAAAAAAAAPNMVFYMSDDLGVGEVSWYPGRSNTNISTPNVDALSAAGMRFTNAYTGSPVCAPSRGSLLTGWHTGHAWIRGNHGSDGFDLPIRANDTTFLQVLHDAGYYTAVCGKWGLGFVNSTGAPDKHGVDEYYGVLDQNEAHNMYPSDGQWTWSYTAATGWVPQPFPNNVGASRTRCMSAGGNCTWTHDLWTQCALNVLDAHAARVQAGSTQPLFLYVAWTDPHAGGWSGTAEEGNPVPSDGRFANEIGNWPANEVDHASVIETYQDRDVGAIDAALQRLGMRDNTVQMFASDNGASNEGGHDYAFFDSSAGLRGFKRCLTEGGIRTPLSITWPGAIPAGVVSSQLVAFYDLSVTILDLAGVPRSQWSRIGTDGTSIKDVLLGTAPAVQHPPAVWEFCTAVHPPLEPRQGTGWGHAIRNDTGTTMWKAVSFFIDQPLRLYNLTADPYEVHDLSAVYPDVVKRLDDYFWTQHWDNPNFPASKNCTGS